jgi:hypothetical protein
MILNLGSLAFNANIATPGGNPAWGTELGQGEGYKFVFENMSDFFTGMVYKAVADTENVTCPLGKGGNQRSDYDFVIASLFDKVYVNRKRVNNARFILLIVKKLNGDHHVGRRTIKYNPRMTYCGEYINEDCYRKMASTIGLSEDAAWFVYEIYIENQDELHFTAFELGQEPQTYKNNDERKNAFISKLPKGTKYSHRISQEPIDFLSTYRPYITAIKSKPFLLLAGISGTGKSRIVRELAFKSCPEYLQDKDGTTPGNYCMIEVKPNWHDSTELLGYYSNLNMSYQFKKFVKFLVKAKMNPEVPFFVCLDEMNLAPVEQYFAEILSIMETRKHPMIEGRNETNKDIIKTGAIIDSAYFEKYTWKGEDGERMERNEPMSDRDWYFEFFNQDTLSEGEKAQADKYKDSYTLGKDGLTLPDNVIIIGTVNMDDTTHQFSRKVIDRAMTIEMNGGKLSNMFGGSKDLEYLPKEEQEKWQNSFRQRYVNADEVLEAHPDEAEDIVKKVPEKLENINKALKGTPFEVSYRVLNELTIMVGVLLDCKKEGVNINDIINQALDHILLMKILPRIEGDSDMFNLSREFKEEYQKKYDIKLDYNNRLEWLMDLAPEIKIEEQEGDDHRQTAREKIREMIERLENQEFTRFWP